MKHRHVSRWLPETGSDVDAIGMHHLLEMNGNTGDLQPDTVSVKNASGVAMSSLGTVSAILSHGDHVSSTTLHVYKDVKDAILSRKGLKALAFLPMDWPQQIIARVSHQEQGMPNIADDKAALMKEFSDVFSDDTPKPINASPMEMLLKGEAKPYSIKGARSIPYAFREKVQAQLKKMVEGGIIEPVTEPYEWCHPIVVASKRHSNEVRMTVDFTKLNSQVARPVHPARTPQDAMGEVQNATIFTTFDDRHGYWQVPLHENSRHLTTFITPWGRYRYLRNPQGFIAAGGEFNKRIDDVFRGIPNWAKVVDDGLVYGSNYATHLQNVRDVLQRARKHGITLSAKKFTFAQERVQFCGYILNSTGWSMDPDKTRAITEFPQPLTRTDLRSFFGLVNQFAQFTKSIAKSAEPLRPLLKTSNEFLWEDHHTQAFRETKEALVATPTLAYFQYGAPTRLETDASRLHGLGFALWQYQGDAWRLIQCGSRFITETEARYAMIELELLAVVWAVRKCHMFLSGSHFELIIDHRPLIPILNSYTLDQIENPRLQRLVMKLQMFQLTATWRRGKDHAVADALSRAPVDDPCGEDLTCEDTPHTAAQICALQCENGMPILPDIKMDSVRTIAAKDSEYQELLKLVRDGFPNKKSDVPLSLRPYWGVHEQLSEDDGLVLKGMRLVVPKSLRQDVLRDLHASHQGIERTRRRARQVVYWPNLPNDISNVVQSCIKCRERLPSQTKEPIINEPRPSLPFQSTSADLFTYAGYQYIVYSDRLSGWPCVGKFGHTVTSKEVIRFLRQRFADVGVPRKLTTDGGPQFASRAFADFCRRWTVNHEKSSPHHHQANGHAEAAVKAVKGLIAKTTLNGDLDVDSFQKGLLEWRNTPRSDGRSPAQVLYGHPLPSFVFAHHRAFAEQWQVAADSADQKRDEIQQRSNDLYNRTARPLGRLRIGEHVDMQDMASRRWLQRGIVVAIGKRRDYFVKLPSGRVLWRNRVYLRPHHPLLPTFSTGHGQGVTDFPSERSSSKEQADTNTSMPGDRPLQQDPHEAFVEVPRRSHRERKYVEPFNIKSTKGQSYE